MKKYLVSLILLLSCSTALAVYVKPPYTIGNGGTGQTTQQSALDALAGSVTSTNFLRGNGTHVLMSTIQGGDLPASSTSVTSLSNLATVGTVTSGAWNGSPITVPFGGTGQTTFTSNLPLVGNGAGAVAQGTVTGNTTKFATSTGALTTGHCISIDASGNLVDSGAACSGGSGNQTVAFYHFVPTASCNWLIGSVSSTLGPFGSNSNCPAPTLDFTGSIGSPQTTLDNLPQVTINALPVASNSYEVTITTTITKASGTGDLQLGVNDGSNSLICTEFDVAGTGAEYSITCSVVFVYSSGTTANKTFAVYAANGGDSSQAQITNNAQSRQLSIKITQLH